MVNSTPDEPVENALSNEMKLQKAWDTLAERSDGVTVVVPEKLEQERGILPESPKVTRNGVSGYLVTLDSMHQANCVVIFLDSHHYDQSNTNWKHRMLRGVVFGSIMKTINYMGQWRITISQISGTKIISVGTIFALKQMPAWPNFSLAHCLKILKQSILCKMNVDMVMGYIQWNKSDPNDFIHFEKNHICKNYTKVLGWIKNKEEP